VYQGLRFVSQQELKQLNKTKSFQDV